MTTRHRLEVCQGPDCFGSGGGAVLLELEELAQETLVASSETVGIVRGGCRNNCTMGPNVYYWNDEQHFTKVKGPAECAHVVQQLQQSQQSLFDGAAGAGPSSTPSMATKMMLRRAERQRWQCWRDMARIQAASSGTNRRNSIMEEIQKSIDECTALELRAFKNDALLLARATRRQQRMQQKLEEIKKATIRSSRTDET
ncbi:expressed unknown protein [Seminavis robusta]|uniref:(2Fe-2S) ferredoxin domain-containing protein n=1 Tax=Seminavis robusta TaxID=568900 RepID=A0A9N8E8Y4_9STRA|nr:expressed unknown protein [Seminavis robusta]|eukprot:Sro815_g206560.1 n/a (199) ;mRNA; r:39173-39769